MGVRRINYTLCDGCGICVDDCPMDVFCMDSLGSKAIIKYLRDCQNCFLCESNCPQDAIYVGAYRERRIPSPAWLTLVPQD